MLHGNVTGTSVVCVHDLLQPQALPRIRQLVSGMPCYMDAEALLLLHKRTAGYSCGVVYKVTALVLHLCKTD